MHIFGGPGWAPFATLLAWLAATQGKLLAQLVGFFFLVRDVVIEFWWAGLGSNQRRRKASRFTVCPV